MSMLTYKPPQYGCVGLCAGDGCAECARLAEHITFAKRQRPGAFRSAWLLLLADQVAGVMGVRRG